MLPYLKSSLTHFLGNKSVVHEASIALAIVDEVCERAERGGAAGIERVFVRVGVMTAVVPDALLFAWDAATSGTLADGSALIVERTPLRIRCAKCACERTVESDIPLPICPVCGSSSSDIAGGRELLVTAMEVRYAPSSGGSSSEHSAQERDDGARAARTVRT
jgi:hydrogenase nickel incorporation protein HypA/HybF